MKFVEFIRKPPYLLLFPALATVWELIMVGPL